MEIDLVALVQRSDVLLLFVCLALGLLLGRLGIRGFSLGDTAGILIAALIMGRLGFDFTQQTESLGFMLFIFCVGIEAGPGFFSAFAQDGVRYISIAAIVAISGVLVTRLLFFAMDLDPGFAAGMLAGALTSTPTLVGAQDVVNHRMPELTEAARAALISQISVGYAVTYVVGLVGILIVIRYVPKLLRVNLAESARDVALERGIDSRRRTIRTPMLRAYRIGAETAQEMGGKTLREQGIYEKTGLIVERIKRDGELIEVDSETVPREGDLVALMGYPSGHARASLKLVDQVFDPDLIEFTLDSEDIVVSRPWAVGKTLRDLQLEAEYRCFADELTRAQVEVPLDLNLRLNRGDILRVSGERSRLDRLIEHIGVVNAKSDVSDLLSFSFFFVAGLVIGQFSVVLGEFELSLGNAGGLLAAGILLGHLRAQKPTFGHIPQGAINMLKDLGLNIFMVGVGLSAGSGIAEAAIEDGGLLLLGGALIMLVPLFMGVIFGSLVLKMNPALVLGAATGAMTSTPALKSVIESADSNIPALGYAGTYTFANVFLTLGGAAIVSL